MKSFLIANPKGGSGKSTLATNLAGYFARCGHRVMLGDTDRAKEIYGKAQTALAGDAAALAMVQQAAAVARPCWQAL